MPLLIACFPLLWVGIRNEVFSSDWRNHIWIIGHVGEYFRQHFAFPLTLNTDEVIGLPYPLFYGSLFYPIAGAISSLTGAAIALRVVLVVVFWVQSVQIVALVKAIYPSRAVAWSVAAVVAFAVYPLTNLYNRSALTEFVAVSLLISACCLWLRVILAGDLRRNWMEVSFAWLLMALCAGTHPITGMLGSLFFGALLLASYGVVKNWAVLTNLIVIHAVMLLLVLAPWVYVTGTFVKHLAISVAPKITVFENYIDRGWNRFVPIPFDLRTVLDEAASTPYLDAQLNFGLIVLIAFLGFQVFRRIKTGQIAVTRTILGTMACLGAFVIVVYASTSLAFWRFVPRVFENTQFAYRLVTYCDLLLFVAVILLLYNCRGFHHEMRNSLGICLTIAVTLMAQGVLVKFTHASTLRGQVTGDGTGLSDDRQVLKRLSGLFNGVDVYVVSVGFAGTLPDSTVVHLPVLGGRNFGDVQQVSLEQRGPFVTNIQSFPWNRIVLNGRVLSPRETYTTAAGRLAWNQGEPGDTVGYRFVPDAQYSILRALSGWSLLIWAALFPVVVLCRGFSKSQREARKDAGAIHRLKRNSLGWVLNGLYVACVLLPVGAIAGLLPSLANLTPSSPPEAGGVTPVSTASRAQWVALVPPLVSERQNVELRVESQESGVLFLRQPESTVITGTTLTAGTVTFSWNAVKGAKDYWIDVGTSPSKGDIRGAYTGGNTSITVDIKRHLNGNPIYVQLYADTGAPMVPGTGLKAQFATATPAAQQATLTAGSVTFTWNAVKGAKDYWLDVGTVASKGNLWAGFTGGKTAVTVDLRNHLNGAPIYVQFFADTGAPMVPGAGVHFAFGTASQ